VKKLILHTEAVKAKFAGITTDALKHRKYAKIEVEQCYIVQVSDTTMMP